MKAENNKESEIEIEELLKRKKEETEALKKMLEKLNLKIINNNTKNNKK